MEPNSGRLPGLEATRPHMEPRAACSAAAPLRRPFHVLVGVTGSVAALKLPVLVSKLLDIPDVSILPRQPLTLESWCAGASPFLCSTRGFLFLNRGVYGSPLCALIWGDAADRDEWDSITRN